MNLNRLIVSALALQAMLGCVSTRLPLPPPDETLRVRSAQVVDADTNQPIEGAVVFTVFYLWPSRGILNLSTPKMFRGCGEAVTDKDGRFTIEGPFDKGSWWSEDLHVYKSGYGLRRFRSDSAGTTKAVETNYRERQDLWERFTSTGVVIELRPLRTRDERISSSISLYRMKIGGAGRRRAGELWTA
jgi:hypothetical protein